MTKTAINSTAFQNDMEDENERNERKIQIIQDALEGSIQNNVNLIPNNSLVAIFNEAVNKPDLQNLVNEAIEQSAATLGRVTRIEASNKRLRWLPDFANLPNVRAVNCNNNELEYLSLPNAEIVNCENNKLTNLDLPNARGIYCSNNLLGNINAPKSQIIICDNNKKVSFNSQNTTIVRGISIDSEDSIEDSVTDAGFGDVEDGNMPSPAVVNPQSNPLAPNEEHARSK